MSSTAAQLAPVRERPILFSAPMVRAILAGRKTQTRRLVRIRKDGTRYDRSPYGAPGERLWVRETWGQLKGAGIRTVYRADADPPMHLYYPDEPVAGMKWRPSIFMRRADSRIDLDVTGVRVERLQDIGEDDARAEGLKGVTKDGNLVKYGIPDRDGWPGTDDDGWPWHSWSADPRKAYERLWDSINDKRAPWSTNPWVWVVTFRRAA
jgi:hypothetical protein